ncbi:MAG: hypothetical protein COC20_00290 [Cellvibrionales bacterium]|nr:MAG: hypothetical protein COC20_00290 [Cellvibrionales bacterium]
MNRSNPATNTTGTNLPMLELVNIVSLECDLAGQLLSTIEQEHAAVLAPNTNVIEKLSTAKNKLASALESAGLDRDGLLKKWGFEAGAQGIVALLKKHPYQALTEAWQSLAELAVSCTEENRLVGIIIGKQLIVANHAIQILKTGAQTSEPIYSASGEVSSETLSSTLVKI